MADSKLGNKDKTAAENARNMAKIEYENAVNSITKIYPTYEEQMKQLFNRIQDMEKQRMLYIKVRSYFYFLYFMSWKSLKL